MDAPRFPVHFSALLHRCGVTPFKSCAIVSFCIRFVNIFFRFVLAHHLFFDVYFASTPHKTNLFNPAKTP